MRAAVIVFPGSNCDADTHYVLNEVVGMRADFVWHGETSLEGYELVLLPGGFSYGDYLRTGAMAAHSPVLSAVRQAAGRGVPVLGICNGFQILLEAGLLPGAMRRNSSLQFQCEWVHLRVESTTTPFTAGAREREVLRMPIAHAATPIAANAGIGMAIPWYNIQPKQPTVLPIIPPSAPFICDRIISTSCVAVWSPARILPQSRACDPIISRSTRPHHPIRGAVWFASGGRACRRSGRRGLPERWGGGG